MGRTKLKSWVMMTAAWMALGVPAAAVLSPQASTAKAASTKADAPAPIAQVRYFRIAPQDLVAALNEFGRQSGRDILFSTDVASRKRSAAVDGPMTAEQALRTLLSNTGLAFRATTEHTFLVELAAAAPQGTPPAGTTNAATDDTQQESETRDDDRKVERVVVTGTHVRGVKDRFSPVRRISRDEMDRAGQTSVSDVLDDLPQNFGGGVATDTVAANSALGVGASAVNLRGLGNEATLVLLNGRRLAPGGATGNFVDISSIPTSAIERIEVLTDGASAIYGSDAIAGVVNIILRDDFEGAETRLNLGAVTDGGGQTLKLGQILGASGEGAHGLIVYEYTSENELDANDKSFASAAIDPTYLLPFNQKHNALFSGGVDLSERVTASADAYYNARKTKSFFSSTTQHIFQDAQVEQFGAAATINAMIFGDWEGKVSAAYSESNQDARFFEIGTNTGNKVDASASVFSVDAALDGSLFSFTDAPVRGVVGVHHRSEGIDQFQIVTPTNGVVNDTNKSRDVFAGFAEIYAPLISDSQNIPGIERLALSAAARFEDFSDVGSSFDPKVGLVWTPINGFNLRGTYGTAFRAPRLDQLIDRVTSAILGVYVDPDSPTGTSVVLNVQGTSSDLSPEEATTWTAGFDLEPDVIKGLQVRGTYFNINYDGRVAIPSFRFDSQFRFADYTGLPIRDPDPATVQGFVDNAAFFLNLSTFFPQLGNLTLADVSTILPSFPQNLSISRVEGVDLDINYRTTSDVGDWAFFVNSTILTSYTQQVTPKTPILDLLDTFGNPLGFRVRGGASLQTKTTTVSLFVNYADDYIDNKATNGTVPVDSWTTVDASLRLDLDEITGGSVTDGVALSFAVTNLFNEDPPRIGPRVPGSGQLYDAANADPAGRRVVLLLTKSW